MTEVKQNVLGEQLAALATYPLQISQLQNAFLWQYGYALKPSMYDCETLMELLQKLNDAVKVGLIKLKNSIKNCILNIEHFRLLTTTESYF